MRTWTHIPQSSGVYQGFVGPECVYVGSSLNLRSRISGHPLRSVCDRWEWSLVPADSLVSAEQALMDRFQPRLNKTKKVCRSASIVIRRNKMYRFNRTIIEAFEEYCRSEYIRVPATVERLMIEYLTKEGYWPPKAKEGK